MKDGSCCFDCGIKTDCMFVCYKIRKKTPLHKCEKTKCGKCKKFVVVKQEQSE